MPAHAPFQFQGTRLHAFQICCAAAGMFCALAAAIVGGTSTAGWWACGISVLVGAARLPNALGRLTSARRPVGVVVPARHARDRTVALQPAPSTSKLLWFLTAIGGLVQLAILAAAVCVGWDPTVWLLLGWFTLVFATVAHRIDGRWRGYLTYRADPESAEAIPPPSLTTILKSTVFCLVCLPIAYSWPHADLRWWLIGGITVYTLVLLCLAVAVARDRHRFSGATPPRADAR